MPVAYAVYQPDGRSVKLLIDGLFLTRLELNHGCAWPYLRVTTPSMSRCGLPTSSTSVFSGQEHAVERVIHICLVWCLVLRILSERVNVLFPAFA